MKKYISTRTLMIFCWGLITQAVFAHPGTGLVVDKYGNVYFIHTGVGVAKITPTGNLTYIYKAVDGHWIEYTNANGPRVEGWLPRVRKIDKMEGSLSWQTFHLGRIVDRCSDVI